MAEKKVYTEAEIEEISEKAAAAAMEHFKHGLNCGECVFQGYLEQKTTDYPPEVVGLVSGMGGGMGFTKHTCGAVAQIRGLTYEETAALCYANTLRFFGLR